MNTNQIEQIYAQARSMIKNLNRRVRWVRVFKIDNELEEYVSVIPGGVPQFPVVKFRYSSGIEIELTAKHSVGYLACLLMHGYSLEGQNG